MIFNRGKNMKRTYEYEPCEYEPIFNLYENSGCPYSYNYDYDTELAIQRMNENNIFYKFVVETVFPSFEESYAELNYENMKKYYRDLYNSRFMFKARSNDINLFLDSYFFINFNYFYEDNELNSEVFFQEIDQLCNAHFFVRTKNEGDASLFSLDRIAPEFDQYFSYPLEYSEINVCLLGREENAIEFELLEEVNLFNYNRDV